MNALTLIGGAALLCGLTCPSFAAPQGGDAATQRRAAHALDASGVYDCQGQDGKEGPYTAVVTLTKVPAHSEGAHVAYRFSMEVPGFGTYLGQAVGRGRHLAIHFALTDTQTRDFGTGLAVLEPGPGPLRFRKFYYQPEYQGGNQGHEQCTRR